MLITRLIESITDDIFVPSAKKGITNGRLCCYWKIINAGCGVIQLNAKQSAILKCVTQEPRLPAQSQITCVCEPVDWSSAIS